MIRPIEGDWVGGWKKLGYDVGVNVVANLIAALILYLLGAWFGLFPSTPSSIAVATSMLLMFGVAVTGLVLDYQRSPLVVEVVLPSLLASMGLLAIAFGLALPDTGFAFFPFGINMFTAAVVMAFVGRHLGRRVRAQRAAQQLPPGP